MFSQYFTRENILDFMGLVALFLLLALGQSCMRTPITGTANTSANDAFYQSLRGLQGKRIEGRTIYPAGREAPFAGKPILLEVASCTKNEMRLPIYIGGKIYRTLILERTPSGFFLKHEDKTETSKAPVLPQSSGQPTTSGPSFPPDTYLNNRIRPAASRVRTSAFNNDQSVFSYFMELEGKLPMQIDFDLPDYLAATTFKSNQQSRF